MQSTQFKAGSGKRNNSCHLRAFITPGCAQTQRTVFGSTRKSLRSSSNQTDIIEFRVLGWVVPNRHTRHCGERPLCPADCAFDQMPILQARRMAGVRAATAASRTCVEGPLWAVHEDGPSKLDFNSFGYCKGVFEFGPKIPDCAVRHSEPQQDLKNRQTRLSAAPTRPSSATTRSPT